MKVMVQDSCVNSKDTCHGDQLSIQDILKFQDATAALKHLQEILGNARSEMETENDAETDAGSLVSASIGLSPSAQSLDSVTDIELLNEDLTISSTPSFIGDYDRHVRGSQYHHMNSRIQHSSRQPSWLSEESVNHNFHSSLDLSTEWNYASRTSRPTMGRAHSFQESVCSFDNFQSKHSFHSQSLQNQRHGWLQPHNPADDRINAENDKGMNVSAAPESFKYFEFVYFDDEKNGDVVESSLSSSPPLPSQSFNVATPVEKKMTPMSSSSASFSNNIKGGLSAGRKASFSDGNERPPTPGLSLVEQLQMDEPLMNAIVKKHKRGYYKCTHCPKTFSNIFEYAAHMDEFEIKRAYKCPFPLCPWKVLGLPRRPDLRRHCAIQHKNELPQHLKDELNLNDEAYPALKCPHQYCEKVFHRRDAYNRHIAIVHEKLNSRFNKRLFQTLADCPYEKEADRLKYVKHKMKSKKQQQLHQLQMSASPHQ